MTGSKGASSRPLVGITTDVVEGDPLGVQGVRLRAQGAFTYIRAVEEAGGLPVLLAPVAELARDYVERCDAIVMTGGADPRTEAFGQPTHPRAQPMHPQRQAFEVALLAALDERRDRPTLGVCLGMQLMSLHAGGRINQCLAETLATHDRHVKDFAHPVAGAKVSGGAAAVIVAGTVASNHRQGIENAGRLRVIATSDDGVIEAVDDPLRPFYLGVQWHPERTSDPNLGKAIFERLIAATRR